MKKLLLILLGLGFGSFSQAQTYCPMAADSTLWKVHVPAQWSVYGYLTKGTSNYYGRTYYRLYGVEFMGSHSEFAFKQATSIAQIGLLREVDKKVYYVPFQNGFPIDPTGGERFLYDFNVSEGDTVYSDLRFANGTFGHEAYYIATNFDTTDGVVSHEALVPSVDSNFSNPLLRERIVHGKGLVTDPFGSIYGTAMLANRSCSMTRGTAIFNSYFPVGVEDWLPKFLHSIKTYPNPVGERLYISGIEALSFPLLFQIFDALGKKVHSSSWHIDDLNQGLEVADLPAGLYFLQLSKDGQLLASEKIIKQ